MKDIYTVKEDNSIIVKSISKIINCFPIGTQISIDTKRLNKGRPKEKKKDEPTQKQVILALLKNGIRVTSIMGSTLFGIVQTTNRCNELIEDGYPVKIDWVCKNGKYFNEYYFTPKYIKELNKKETLPDIKIKK